MQLRPSAALLLLTASCSSMDISDPPAAGPTGAPPIQGFEALFLDVQHPGGETERVAYRLRVPEGAEDGAPLPLIVFLHGAGERGDENERQLIHFGDRFADPAFAANFGGYVLAPQCPEEQRWAEASWNQLPPPAMDDEPSESMREVMAILDHTLDARNIDRTRVYLTGLSMGGQGSWDLAIRRPETFAAVAPVCGGADPRAVAVLRDVPVWSWHGVDDGAVPFERSRLMVEALREAGGAPRFTELPEGTGHAAWNAAYAPDSPLWAWLESQHR